MASLDGMNLKLDGIGHAISDNSLAVPMYQRSYAWGDKHVEDLFKDLATALDKSQSEKEYFLGSVVVVQNATARLEVVDGQQRLATITILLAAIQDWFHTTGDENRANDLEAKYLISRELRSQERIAKLHLNESDNDFFYKRVLSLPNEPNRKAEAVKDSHRRISKAADIARKHVDRIVSATNTPVDRLLDWVDYIDASAKVIWVLVPDYANAFTIFETLNDRGLALALSDLLKNYLFSLAKERRGEVQQRWLSMVGAIEAAESEELVVTYVRHLWSSQQGLTREKDLYTSIKSRITSKQGSIDFANNLSTSSRMYAAILNPDHDLWGELGATASSDMSILNLLGMVQMRPLLLSILDVFSHAHIQRILKLLVSWAVRFTISGRLGSGSLESHYSRCAVDIRQKNIADVAGLIKAMQNIVPGDGDFESSFATASVTKATLARYYLRVLEGQLRQEEGNSLLANADQTVVTLEHILPQSPSAAWHHVDPESARLFFNRIGNLTLMQSKLNSDAGNDGFAEKLQYYKRSPFRLTSSLQKYITWGTVEIEERQRDLAALAVKAWPHNI